MMYKFIDEYNVQEWDKKYIILNEKQISYPSCDILLQAGYKPLVEADEIPEFNPDNQIITERNEELEDKIIKKHVVNEMQIPIEEVVKNE